ncbi:MAG TPA: hypothetical protein VF815_30265 [Myxococcaceae bacterium]|jgi:hypothetical protein
MGTISKQGLRGEDLVALAKEAPAEGLGLEGLEAVTPEQIQQLLEAYAPALRSLRLSPKEYGQLDLTAVSWNRLSKLEGVSLQSCEVSAELLQHPTLERISLERCSVSQADEVVLGPKVQTLDIIDSNPRVGRLKIEGNKFWFFTLSQDEDYSEASFDVIEFRSPTLTRVRHKAEYPTELIFAGEFPALKSKNVQIEAGNYSCPRVDVSGVTPPSPLLTKRFPKKARNR